MSILEEILSKKRSEVESRRAAEPESSVKNQARNADPPRDFRGALEGAPATMAGVRVIAEIKRASPSRGPIRPGADAAATARAYTEAGAVALSVLTDAPYFDGSLEDIAQVRRATPLPILRKDFVIDPYQVWEARAAGADAVLLITRALEDKILAELLALVRGLGMEALVEIHDREEMVRAAALRPGLIGINNRNLSTLKVSLETTRELVPLRPPGALIVSESGFSRLDEMMEMQGWGVDAFLVGESLMSAKEPGEALRAITGGPAPVAGFGERPDAG